MRKTGAEKISPGKSEDPPELSAGSSESEDLPDPTCEKLSELIGAGQPHRLTTVEKEFATSGFFVSGRLPDARREGEQPFACVGFTLGA